MAPSVGHKNLMLHGDCRVFLTKVFLRLDLGLFLEAGSILKSNPDCSHGPRPWSGPAHAPPQSLRSTPSGTSGSSSFPTSGRVHAASSLPGSSFPSSGLSLSQPLRCLLASHLLVTPTTESAQLPAAPALRAGTLAAHAHSRSEDRVNTGPYLETEETVPGSPPQTLI